MADRLAFVRYMQTNFFGKLNAGNQFRAIEGVITFFQKNSLGAPESWVSYVDAGIVEGIERGGAIALGMSTEDGGNKGSALWASFLSRKRDGQLNDLDVRWPFCTHWVRLMGADKTSGILDARQSLVGGRTGVYRVRSRQG